MQSNQPPDKELTR
jgi:hypothetical protein